MPRRIVLPRHPRRLRKARNLRPFNHHLLRKAIARRATAIMVLAAISGPMEIVVRADRKRIAAPVDVRTVTVTKAVAMATGGPVDPKPDDTASRMAGMVVPANAARSVRKSPPLSSE
jgi:hypothetical protein